MLKYFSLKENLTEVLDYMNTNNPRIVISEYNCLVDNRLFKRDDDNSIYVVDKFKDFINDLKTIEFKIIDNKFTLSEIIDGLKVNGFYEPILRQEELSLKLLEKYGNIIDGTNNIWSIKLDDYKKNNLIYMYINEDYFTNVDIFLLFSTLYDAISFILVHEIKENIKVIVFDIQSRYNEKIKTKFLEILQ